MRKTPRMYMPDVGFVCTWVARDDRLYRLVLLCWIFVVGSYDWRVLCRWVLKKVLLCVCVCVVLVFVVDIFDVVHEMVAAAESVNGHVVNGGVSVCLSVDVVQLVSDLERLSCASKHGGVLRVFVG